MASITAKQARNEVANIYPWKRWKQKISKMSDNQILAMHFKMLKQGKFSKIKNKEEEEF